MGDKELSYNCRLELSKNNAKTSTQIGLAYSPEKTVTYEKVPMGRLPKTRIDPSFKFGSVNVVNTTYRDTYKVPIQKDKVHVGRSKVLKQVREYTKFGHYCRPLKFGMSEYNTEFTLKESNPCTQGINIEKLTTFPLVLTGRDERDPLPLTENYGRHLDIYVTTNRATHRMFSLKEQKGIAFKDIVTSHETMAIPKGRGFGCKFPCFPGQDLDNRDKNMIDKVLFKYEHKLRFMPQGMPRVPNFGSESEIQSAYKQPSGVAISHIFDRFIEFPEWITVPAAKQALCAPGMYTTESYAINNHTSPQTVV